LSRRVPERRGRRSVRSGGEGGRCLLFNSTRTRGFAAFCCERPGDSTRYEVPDPATDAMTTHVRPSLPRAAGSFDGPNGGARPRLAGDDDNNKRRDKGTPGAPGTAVITKTKPQTKRPNLYRVLLLNDDYTPMEFVVLVLERFFNKDREAATRIMLHV